MKNQIIEQVKEAIRQPVAWPGGYPIYTIMADGELMCPSCAADNFRAIFEATKNHDNSGWRSAGADVYWEGEDQFCCNCNTPLESAYGDPDAE